MSRYSATTTITSPTSRMDKQETELESIKLDQRSVITSLELNQTTSSRQRGRYSMVQYYWSLSLRECQSRCRPEVMVGRVRKFRGFIHIWKTPQKSLHMADAFHSQMYRYILVDVPCEVLGCHSTWWSMAGSKVQTRRESHEPLVTKYKNNCCILSLQFDSWPMMCMKTMYLLACSQLCCSFL